MQRSRFSRLEWPHISPASNDDPPEPLNIRLRNRIIYSALGLVAIAASMAIARKEIISVMLPPLVMSAERMATTLALDDVPTLHLTVQGDNDLGSPFHMIRSWYRGTPQPWMQAVETHFRLLEVDSKILLIRAPGSSPEDLPPDSKAPRKQIVWTGFLVSMPYDTRQFLQKMHDEQHLNVPIEQVLPMMLDCVQSAWTVPGWLLLALTTGIVLCTSLYRSARTLWRLRDADSGHSNITSLQP